jgi:hypothetical protein
MEYLSTFFRDERALVACTITYSCHDPYLTTIERVYAHYYPQLALNLMNSRKNVVFLGCDVHLHCWGSNYAAEATVICTQTKSHQLF